MLFRRSWTRVQLDLDLESKIENRGSDLRTSASKISEVTHYSSSLFRQERFPRRRSTGNRLVKSSAIVCLASRIFLGRRAQLAGSRILRFGKRTQTNTARRPERGAKRAGQIVIRRWGGQGETGTGRADWYLNIFRGSF